MRPWLDKLAAVELLLFAFAWPWDVYQYIPGSGLYLTEAIAALLGLSWLVSVFQTRSVRLPFEFAWPLALLIGLGWLTAAGKSSGVDLPSASFAIVFCATLHFAADRRFVERCFALMVLAGSAAAVLSLLGPALGIWPTAYSTATPLTMSFAGSLGGGMFTLAIVLVIAVNFGVARQVRPLFRVLAWAGAFIVAAMLVSALAQLFKSAPPWDAPDYRALSVWSLAALLTMAWLVARIAAKILVARRVGPARPQAALLAVVVGGAIYYLIFPMPQRAAFPFLLGLASAYVLPPRGPSPRGRAAWLLAAVAAGLIVYNVGHLDPGNLRDPRHYEVAILRLVGEKEYRAARERLDRIDRFSPAERRTHFYRAVMLLDEGRARMAAEEFRFSLEPWDDGEEAMLPMPAKAQQNDFLVRLRDLCSVEPALANSCAYETALAATGEYRNALASLRARVDNMGVGRAAGALAESIEALDVDRPALPVTQGVAALLGTRGLAKGVGSEEGNMLAQIGQWPLATQIQALLSAGAKVHKCNLNLTGRPPYHAGVFVASWGETRIQSWCFLGGGAGTNSGIVYGPSLAGMASALAPDAGWDFSEASGEFPLRVKLRATLETSDPNEYIGDFAHGDSRGIRMGLRSVVIDESAPAPPLVAIWIP